jgi:hypothetical protein
MNNEQQFIYKIRQVLNLGTAQIAPATAARLHAARQEALEHHRVSAGGLAMAGIGSFMTDTLPSHLRMAAISIAVLAGVAFTYVWTNFEQAAENEEIDSVLLADDLPPQAFLDKGFVAWLDRSAPPSR